MLKETVETFLKLQPVDKPEWATPIIVEPKSDGGIRICGDFKATINPVICPQVFLLPMPEEMFSILANGKSFTKLDLSRAYKQMKIKEECQSLMINMHLGFFPINGYPLAFPQCWLCGRSL